MTNSVGSPETMADELDLTDTVPWRDLLAETVVILRFSGITENADLEARWIMEEATGTTGSEFMDVLAHCRRFARSGTSTPWWRDDSPESQSNTCSDTGRFARSTSWSTTAC